MNLGRLRKAIVIFSGGNLLLFILAIATGCTSIILIWFITFPFAFVGSVWNVHIQGVRR